MMHMRKSGLFVLLGLCLILGACVSRANEHTAAQASPKSHPSSWAPTPVYNCIVDGGSKQECLKLARPAREGFIEARMRAGVSREAAIKSWNMPSSNTVRTRCTGFGTSTVECETSY
jgi:hypothetical protein